jgi:stage V sporulation protein AE
LRRCGSTRGSRHRCRPACHQASSFGNALVKGVLPALEKDGVIGLLTGMFQITSTGIAAAIVFAWIVAVIFNPKS